MMRQSVAELLSLGITELGAPLQMFMRGQQFLEKGSSGHASKLRLAGPFSI